MQVLKQLNIFPNTSQGPYMIEVLNKVDKAPKSLKENISKKNNQVLVSAKTGEGVDMLIKKIEGYLSSI